MKYISLFLLLLLSINIFPYAYNYTYQEEIFSDKLPSDITYEETMQPIEVEIMDAPPGSGPALGDVEIQDTPVGNLDYKVLLMLVICAVLLYKVRSKKIRFF